MTLHIVESPIAMRLREEREWQGECFRGSIPYTNCVGTLEEAADIIDDLCRAGEELANWYGPFNPAMPPPEINGSWLRLQSALAKARGEA